MEPAQNALNASYARGFSDGYGFVLEILRLVKSRRTHLNPIVRRVLNTALLEIIIVLEQDKETIHAELSQPPIKSIHQTPDRG
jgi:hypothetical protein